MVDIQSTAAEIRRGKKRRRRKKSQDENIMVCPIPQGEHKNREWSTVEDRHWTNSEVNVIRGFLVNCQCAKRRTDRQHWSPTPNQDVIICCETNGKWLCSINLTYKITFMFDYYTVPQQTTTLLTDISSIMLKLHHCQYCNSSTVKTFN